MIKAVVYSINHPLTGYPFYIGQSYNYKNRCSSHINKNNSTAPVAKYIRYLKSIGLIPTFSIVKNCQQRTRYDWEDKYIRLYLKQGHLLLNMHGNLNLEAAINIYFKNKNSNNQP